ncbi:MAG: efflux transporter outer membrane subunit [Deltaproteobacteria bacterium]|nr:efflux transporter outer membrane subunit [Deltaproteobacteria bacterium]
MAICTSNWFRPLLILVLCLLSTAGCAVGPDYHKPETKVPDNWNGQEVVTKDTPSKTTPDPAALIDWWQAFNDPSLSALVEMAIRANLDLRLAEARIRQARAALGVAGGAFWPTVDATALYERSHSAIVAIGPSGGGASGGGSGGSSGGGSGGTSGGGVSEGVSVAPFRELFQVGLDASWEIDIFGGVRRNIEAAGADLRASVEDRRDVLITLVGDVGSNYVNLRGFQQQIDIARKNLEAQKHNADIIQKRHDAGFVGGLDVANARAQVATTEATIPIFESSARAAIYNLGVLLGREPAALEKDLIKPGPIPPYPPGVPVGLPSDLLRRRPDIRRAEAQLHAATARIGVATAALFPQFSLTGTMGISSNDLTKLSNLANSKFWSFGPSVTWPIFAGGSLWWGVKVQDALAEQALLTYQKTVLTALKDVETALVAYAKQQETRKSLSEAVVQNRKAVELAMLLYMAGKSDFLNVIIAQRSLFNTEDALAVSIRTVDTNLIALYKALGGGWENTPSLISAKPPANIILPVKASEP